MGYRRIGEGINNVLLTLDLVLKIITTKQAINHFHMQSGVESFLFLPQDHIIKKKICVQELGMSPTFYDNVNTRCSLEEVAY